MSTPGGEPAGTLRISIRLPHSRCLASPDAIVRVAELAEELGFWGVSVEDHYLLPDTRAPAPTQGRWPDDL